MTDDFARELEAKTIAQRRHVLYDRWSISDAEALLRLSPTLEHIALCVQSLLLDTIASEDCADMTVEELEDHLAFPLGCIASWSSAKQLDDVLCHHTPWLRFLELTWLCDCQPMMFLLLRDPLADHPLGRTIAAALHGGDSAEDNVIDLTGPYAAAIIAWWFEISLEDNHIEFRYVPRVGQACHVSVQRFFQV